jgi:hypothetical protein
MKERIARIDALVTHLTGDAPHRTPAEVLRYARFVPGWAVQQTPPGLWTVSGASLVEAVVDSPGLIAMLRTFWLPEARHELRAPAAGEVAP